MTSVQLAILPYTSAVSDACSTLDLLNNWNSQIPVAAFPYITMTNPQTTGQQGQGQPQQAHTQASNAVYQEQHPDPVQEQHHQHLADLVRRNFPPINFAFAYGSGVFVQPDLYRPSTSAGSGPMTDFIFVVDDPLQWHTQVRSSRAVGWLGPFAPAVSTVTSTHQEVILA